MTKLACNFEGIDYDNADNNVLRIFTIFINKPLGFIFFIRIVKKWVLEI